MFKLTDANWIIANYENYIKDGCNNIEKDLLDLAKRQKAEIGVLRNKLNNKYRNCTFVGSVAVHTDHLRDYARFLCLIKSEAYKEFAERLREKAMQKFDWNEYIEVEDIDNTYKELTEGGNEDG